MSVWMLWRDQMSSPDLNHRVSDEKADSNVIWKEMLLKCVWVILNEYVDPNPNDCCVRWAQNGLQVWLH